MTDGLKSRLRDLQDYIEAARKAALQEGITSPERERVQLVSLVIVMGGWQEALREQIEPEKVRAERIAEMQAKETAYQADMQRNGNLGATSLGGLSEFNRKMRGF